MLLAACRNTVCKNFEFMLTDQFTKNVLCTLVKAAFRNK